jgi:hypothetical protein
MNATSEWNKDLQVIEEVIALLRARVRSLDLANAKLRDQIRTFETNSIFSMEEIETLVLATNDRIDKCRKFIEHGPYINGWNGWERELDKARDLHHKLCQELQSRKGEQGG